VSELKVDLSLPRKTIGTWKYSNTSNLIHLAGIVGPSQVKKDLTYSYRVNVLGTLGLAELFLEKSSGTFYFISTSHVYKKDSQPLHENSEIEPLSEYSEQKIITEQSLIEMFSSVPSRLCILRIFSVLDWHTPEFTLGGAIRKLCNEQNYNLQNGDDVRDFLDPATIAQGIFQIAAEGSLSGIVNFCSGTGMTIRNAAITMLRQAGKSLGEGQILSGNSENPLIIGNNERLRKEHPNLDLTWKPKLNR